MEIPPDEDFRPPRHVMLVAVASIYTSQFTCSVMLTALLSAQQQPHGGRTSIEHDSLSHIDTKDPRSNDEV
jgi:hypothetical protein